MGLMKPEPDGRLNPVVESDYRSEAGQGNYGPNRGRQRHRLVPPPRRPVADHSRQKTTPGQFHNVLLSYSCCDLFTFDKLRFSSQSSSKASGPSREWHNGCSVPSITDVLSGLDSTPAPRGAFALAFCRLL